MSSISTARLHKWHGILLMALFALAAFYLSTIPFLQNTLRLSPLIIGVILGMIYANTFRVAMPDSWVPGVQFTGKRILRLAIVFYAFRLTITDVVSVGLEALWLGMLVVSITVLLGISVGKWLGLDSETTLLTATGSAVCGAAAVLGADSVVQSQGGRVVIAVSTVVIFGTLSMFLYPILYRTGCLQSLDARQVGLYTGATLHEVAHVAGAGASMGVEQIAGVATITKMIRVILLAPFLLILSWYMQRKRKQQVQGTAAVTATPIRIPWFALWFLVMIGVNSLLMWGAGRYGVESSYRQVQWVIERIDTFALTMAMVALGTDASVAKFREAGFKPFLLALVLWVWLIVGGYGLVVWLT